MAQSLIVALLVAGCLLYASWTLAPRALRRALAVTLTRRSALVRRLPSRWQAALQKAALSGAGGGCGCDASDGAGGCPAQGQGSGGGQSKAEVSWQPVQWNPKRRH